MMLNLPFSSWSVDGKTIARKVKTCSLPLVNQINDYVAVWKCPQCHYTIDNSNVWPGFPIGVKFEPNDVELLEHLKAKCSVGNKKPHQFIDEFIPTLDVDEGICSKHPEHLPGSTKDGNKVHFFYKIAKAHATGQRKRRKICKESKLTEDVRWHKTGKTIAIMQNGVQMGWKKIMVLYRACSGGSKPFKLNWVMHQYHLGTVKDEKEGEYVVARIFYQQQKDIKKVDNNGVIQDLNVCMNLTSPKSSKTDALDPRKIVFCDNVVIDRVIQSPTQVGIKEKMKTPVLEEDSQAVDLDAFVDSLFCNENRDTCGPIGDGRLDNGPLSRSNMNGDCVRGPSRGASSGFDYLENLDLGYSS